MADIEKSGKEETILGLSNQLNNQLEKLLARLEDTFERDVKPEKGEGVVGKDVPQVPNVLDQIISNLEESSNRIDGIHNFINGRVILKIH
jgi:hypothetical protein